MRDEDQFRSLNRYFDGFTCSARYRADKSMNVLYCVKYVGRVHGLYMVVRVKSALSLIHFK